MPNRGGSLDQNNGDRLIAKQLTLSLAAMGTPSPEVLCPCSLLHPYPAPTPRRSLALPLWQGAAAGPCIPKEWGALGLPPNNMPLWQLGPTEVTWGDVLSVHHGDVMRRSASPSGVQLLKQGVPPSSPVLDPCP